MSEYHFAFFFLLQLNCLGLFKEILRIKYALSLKPSVREQRRLAVSGTCVHSIKASVKESSEGCP